MIIKNFKKEEEKNETSREISLFDLYETLREYSIELEECANGMQELQLYEDINNIEESIELLESMTDDEYKEFCELDDLRMKAVKDMNEKINQYQKEIGALIFFRDNLLDCTYEELKEREKSDTINFYDIPF